MANFISEEDIQKELVGLFLNQLHYNEHLFCKYDDHKLGRISNKKVIGQDRLQKALYTINDHLPKSSKSEAIKDAIRELTRNRTGLEPLAANKEIHQLIKNGHKTPIKDDNGREQEERVIYIDFHNQEKNEFVVVEELPITQKKGCRTDLLVYVNGIPLVFIELKNSNVEVENAYTDNLRRYKRDIPTLFHYNAFNILSNGITTKIGSFTAEWEHYSEWKRIKDENEKYDNTNDELLSLARVVKGMCDKKRLLDIFENFIFYFADNAKIVAKNHQYIGVNNGIASFENRLKKEGKLGVFWHTQGSGKSYSMIFFTMKIFRKYTGDYTFVIITDRDSLDDQIYKNFLRAEAISEKDEAQALSREHLKTMLGESNKKYIFTLIQKFGTEKGEKFPLLTERSDIIVLVDEAHRSQYNTFAENMRTAMPNANYLAFTGTPLLDANETTKKWFGEYVSEYNFAQSMEDGATVPLFYENRVPEVQLGNKFLNKDFAEIVENDSITDEQEERLKQKYATELEIIQRDARLKVIAKDIVEHFPYREYRGKAMVISIDKFTTVKMYNFVKTYWEDEKQKINRQISEATTQKEREEYRAILQFMRKTEMYVVVSKDGKDEDKFAKRGLDIKPHHDAMAKKYGKDKLTLKDRFQKDNDPFRLVFVCSKWLTGFDSPTINTLYLDKPMQNHSLMQTIARANRVSTNKTCGIIVDYFGVFENLEKAIDKYTKKNNSKLDESDKPIRDKTILAELLAKTAFETKLFLAKNDCDIELILKNDSTFATIKHFEKFANNLSKTEELRKEYNVHENAIRNIYQATQPDNQIKNDFKRIVEAYEYLRQIINRENNKGDYKTAVDKTRILLDESIYSNGYENNTLEEPLTDYSINKEGQPRVDLRTLNFEAIEKKFKQTELKYLAIVDLKDFLQHQLEIMMRKNSTRINFAEKMQEIIDKYNAKSYDVNKFFDELKEFMEQLRKEDLRAEAEGLTEDELQIFDLLYNKDKLTKAEKQKVKLASKELLIKLRVNKEDVMVEDWHKHQRQRIQVERYIMAQLYPELKDIYDNQTFKEKSKGVFTHFIELAESGRLAIA